MGTPRSIAFGTSGLRGPAEAFEPALTGDYVAAFLDTACASAREKTVAIGIDRRVSSPRIAGIVAAAVAAKGWRPMFCGVLPTPALAAFSMSKGIPAVMVTGSHIPADQNGLKFYRPDGELRKTDEAPISAAVEALDGSVMPSVAAGLPNVDNGAREAYKARVLAGFADDALVGHRLGVYAHSAAGWQDMVDILENLGGRCIVLDVSERFVAVDTEAVGAETIGRLQTACHEHGFDAVVSTDGDGDRPLLIDANGRQINGDIVGALAARALGADTVVTPLTSTSAIETCGWFAAVKRTKIGSPYVIDGMEAASGKRVVGFEANGGFLVQTPLTHDGREIAPLPTRDALLPLVAVLAQAKKRNLSVRELADELPERAMVADRLKAVAAEIGNGLVAELAHSRALRTALGSELGELAGLDTTDGTRMTRTDGVIVHVRQSGNAPELRCYVEAHNAQDAHQVLAAMMARLAEMTSHP